MPGSEARRSLPEWWFYSRPPLPPDAASILTHKCWCGGVVLGPEIADWQGLDLETTPVALLSNGTVVDQA